MRIEIYVAVGACREWNAGGSSHWYGASLIDDWNLDDLDSPVRRYRLVVDAEIPEAALTVDANVASVEQPTGVGQMADDMFLEYGKSGWKAVSVRPLPENYGAMKRDELTALVESVHQELEACSDRMKEVEESWRSVRQKNAEQTDQLLIERSRVGRLQAILYATTAIIGNTTDDLPNLPLDFM